MRFRSVLLSAAVASCFAPTIAVADDVTELKAQMEALQKQLDAVKAQLQTMQAQQAPAAPAAGGGSFLQLKPGPGVHFLVPGGGDVQFYGNLNVSFDYGTKGLKSDYGVNGGMPVGKMGWEPDISSNLSALGLRGTHPLHSDLDFVWQLEAGIDISATPGTKETTSNTSDVVNGALFSRNSFLGFAGKDWGGVRIGKNETPYKTSTDPLNPFSGMFGDYRVIMGNTGGDNRVEFGLRAAHAIWYESPDWSGFSFKAMFSPGQNRDDTSSIVAEAEPDCTGGNIPGSGATPPLCNDGSFGDLWSISGLYKQGPLYVTAAYELHKNVNRTSDLANLDPRDVGDETAVKVGVQYKFPTKTTVDFVWERTHRDLPSDLEFQNERSRPNATWLAATQQITDRDSISAGWAHASKSKGFLGVHNTPDNQTTFDNSANMYTIAWRHAIDRYLSIYADYALTVNAADAHYDLGAGGHGVTIDCHDSTPLAAFDATTGGVTNTGPHCYSGGRLQGISFGVQYQF
ncbi:MAG TPA: porin [Casimicrobiaceae bacterium]|nr:porin [Casimicrobiaceae bacterium]